MGGSQFTMTLWMGYAQTTKNDNGDGPHSRFPGFVHIPSTGSWWTGTPPSLQGGGRCRIRPWRNTEYVPGRQFAIFIQVSNRGRNGCIKSWFFQYISLPMKYTVSDSILQYNVGLTLSFLSLISIFEIVGDLSWGHLGHIIRYAFERTGTACHGILRYGKIYEYSLFVCLFGVISLERFKSRHSKIRN